MNLSRDGARCVLPHYLIISDSDVCEHLCWLCFRSALQQIVLTSGVSGWGLWTEARTSSWWFERVHEMGMPAANTACSAGSYYL